MIQRGRVRRGTPSLTLDDRALATRALHGDGASFDALVDRYLERTFHIALRMVGNREDAEDVVQDAFARAHQRLADFRGGGKFGTWITSIAIRLCLDLERRRKRRPPLLSIDGLQIERSQDATGSIDLPCEAPSPPQQLQHRELVSHIDHAITRLPPRLKTAFVLRVLEEFDYEDVASTMGTTIRSARIYVAEARRRLAAAIERGPNERGPNERGQEGSS